MLAFRLWRISICTVLLLWSWKCYTGMSKSFACNPLSSEARFLILLIIYNVVTSLCNSRYSCAILDNWYNIANETWKTIYHGSGIDEFQFHVLGMEEVMRHRLLINPRLCQSAHLDRTTSLFFPNTLAFCKKAVYC